MTLPIPKKCNICGGVVIKTNNCAVYGRNIGKWPFIYLCNNCGAYVGLHTTTDIPLGTLADERTRDARTTYKPFFNSIWQKGFMTRTEAYKELAHYLGISKSECHWGLFDVDRCKKAHEFYLKVMEFHGENIA